MSEHTTVYRKKLKENDRTQRMHNTLISILIWDFWRKEECIYLFQVLMVTDFIMQQ